MQTVQEKHIREFISKFEEVETKDKLIRESVEKIRSKVKIKKTYTHRMCVIKILRDAGYKLDQIGTMVNRDHASVMNALERYNDYEYTKDPYFLSIQKHYKGKENAIVEQYSKFLGTELESI